MASSGANALPPKEASLFKSVVRLYETKQFKKAVKTADTILKKFPQHGETLAMKGLTLNSLDKKTEAYELVRKGLMRDMRSHICWHVYGLLYRSDRDYREATKAYLNALRIDNDNQQILRDLALLQIQIRDYDGLQDTRRRLLTVKPNQKINWIGFALSYHLLGNYRAAISVLDTYQDTLKDSPDTGEEPYEVSELLMYKNLIIEESGDFAAALEHLNANAARIVDIISMRETRARLLAALGKYRDAEVELRALLVVNVENHAYYRGLISCVILAANGGKSNSAVNGVAIAGRDVSETKVAMVQRRIVGPVVAASTDEEVRMALSVCNDLALDNLRSRTAPRIALDVLPSGLHPEFLPRCDTYVRSFLRRGVPSLFSDIKPLYANASKGAALGVLFEGYRKCLENADSSRLPPVLAMPSEDGEDDPASTVVPQDGDGAASEPPCTLLWVYHFLAQHYDRLGLRKLALESIDLAIAHTPTAIECYLVKARILKHCGDFVSAVKVADEGRNLDLADRYLNTKCAKYGLRADMVTEAENWVGLFTRDGDSGGVQALYDMQCMWFELEAAESHLRRGQLALALKKFTAVDRHFADMVEDQFDFHSYCLRKVTLRAYVSLLRFEDRIRNNPYYARASAGLVQCLLRLHDMPERARVGLTGEHADIVGFADMSDAERKKAISKQKKRDAKKRQQPSSNGGRADSKIAVVNGGDKLAANGTNGKSGASGTGTTSGNDSKPKKDPGWMEIDSLGQQLVKDLLKCEDGEKGPLAEATRVVRELERHLGHQIETHALAFEVAIRKKRYLQALRAAKRALAIEAEHPKAVGIAVRFVHELQSADVRGSLSKPVATVIEAEGELLSGLTPLEYVRSYATRNSTNALRRVGAAQTLMWLTNAGVSNAGSLEEACGMLAEAVRESAEEGVDENALDVPFCRALVDGLRADGVSKELIAKVASACQEKYPRASCFGVKKTDGIAR